MSLNTNFHSDKGKKYGRSLFPWHFSKEDLIINTGSRQDGMTYEEELYNRQKACKFLSEMVINLTHAKGDHLATGVAAVILNRFFKFHSFKRLDYRDVAAACLFLAGKNEDSPRKLKYIVNTWWQLKYPHQKTFQSEAHFLSACELITALENCVLRTLAFDMNVELPHQFLLHLMHEIERGKGVYKDMVRTAYYLATDVLMVTDWSLRYSCSAIGAACLEIACFFHDLKMSEIAPPNYADNWYRKGDPHLTAEKLKEMVDEFLDVFSKHPELHIGSLKKIDTKGKVKIFEPSPVVSSTLPPPPAAPMLTAPKKIDMTTYKERQKSNLAAAAAVITTTSPRQSFLPDVQNPAELKKQLEKQKKEGMHVDTSHRDRYFEKTHTSEYRRLQRPHSNGDNKSERQFYNEDRRPDRPSSNGSYSEYLYPIGNDHADSKLPKRGHGGVKHEYEMSLKRSRTESSSSTSISSSTHISASLYDRHAGSKKSAYLKQVEATTMTQKHGTSDVLKPRHSSPSAYQKICMEMDNRQRQHSQDPSPPTCSPPEPPLNLRFAPPPPPPPVFIDMEMEDGELL
ncbi:unnamed protein product [Caenorhabditis bovis]|uniref:Cyclin-like domain-containing protein n=1 Tax=Caenorhabditis bovis TaxID=2654633 RepID=A0A8S1EJH6_9PELO|nr:unnamed protein product [Caenorhabditis bovis]